MSFLNDKPAILGGVSIFEKIVPLSRPTLPNVSTLIEPLTDILSTGQLSCNGKYVKTLEYRICNYLSIEHSLAVSNGTSGLILLLKALGLKGKVILPSFNFSASVHALKWCNIEPVFVDIDPFTFNIDCNKIEELIDNDTSAVLGLNCFGVPCENDTLKKIASKFNLSLLFDSTHAFGSKYKNQPIGTFGEAEVFSTSATKLFTTGEGGFVTTSSAVLAEKIEVLRNYGNALEHEKMCVGLNGRMNELSAILGLSTIDYADINVKNRNHLAKIYQNDLKYLPGISFQHVPENSLSTYKDFAIVIDSKVFGISRNLLIKALKMENIDTKSYFFPPIHQHPSYIIENVTLKNTEQISENVLSLPMYSHLEESTVLKVIEALRRIHKNASEILKLN
jgi:dTDP-4-amino-4,6-dideoxygalactose transaminase